MTTTAIDPKVLSRLEKLKAMAEDASNEYESFTALAKLQRLLVEHQLDESVLGPAKKGPSKEDVVKVVFAKTPGTPYPFLVLANYIANALRCRYVADYSWKYARNGTLKRQYKNSMMGLPLDAEVAAATWKLANQLLNRLLREKFGSQSFRGRAARVNSYSIGFAKGLKEVLDAQVAQESWSLIIVTPEAVLEKLADEYKVTTTKHPSVYTSLVEAGYQEGRKFTRTPLIG